MTTVGAFEAKNTLGSLLDRVERGEEVVITRHGRPVARLVPNTPRVDQAQAESAFNRIRERAQSLNKQSTHKTKTKRASFDWPTLKKVRDQGRP